LIRESLGERRGSKAREKKKPAGEKNSKKPKKTV